MKCRTRFSRISLSTSLTFPRSVLRRMTAQSNLKYNNDIFNYTRGRFVCDEALELSQRHVRFDVEELGRVAAKAIGAGSCISIEKYPDGMYNKAMLLTMDNNLQVVVKVPNPNAGQPHFTTASEVATMDFVRNKLGTPVPKVFAWSSKAENPVGAEYIIMEKVDGIELEEVWPSMKIADRFAVVKAIAGFQNAWSLVSFKRFGSLYYAKDLEAENESFASKGIKAKEVSTYTDSNGINVIDSLFAVGPSTGREFWDHGRAAVSFDRGPWNSLQEYQCAIGHREMTCVSQLPHLPKSPITLCGPGTYQPTRQRKLEALRCYLKLIPFIGENSFASSHLWHGDLHAANIFVNPSNVTEIVSIIDWQSTELLPLYQQARRPHLIDYEGPPIYGLERPQKPESKMSKEEEALYLQQSLCSLYNTLIYHQSPQIYGALEFQQTPNYDLILLARNILVDGEITYRCKAAELAEKWSQGDCPISFSPEERHQLEVDIEGVERGMLAMSSIRESIGELFPEQGIVRLDQYDEALDALSQMKEQVIAEFATNDQERDVWLKAWPFGT